MSSERDRLGSLTIKNIGYDQAKSISESQFGSMMWANGKAYPLGDVVCDWQSNTELTTSLLEAQADSARLREALEFYGSIYGYSSSWDSTNTGHKMEDKGKIARKALAIESPSTALQQAIPAGYTFYHVRDAAQRAKDECAIASGQHSQIDRYVNATQIAHSVCGTDLSPHSTALQEHDNALIEKCADKADETIVYYENPGLNYDGDPVYGSDAGDAIRELKS